MSTSDHAYGVRAGFTLLEVLVSIAILAMIATIVFGTFFYTVNNTERLEDRAALYHRAGYILGTISQSVASAYAPYGGVTVGEEGERPVFQGGSESFGETSSSSLSMYTTDPRFTGEDVDAEIAYVSYEMLDASDAGDMPGWIEDDNNPLVLACYVEPLLALSDNESEDTGEVLPMWNLNVRSLSFAFFDGTQWLEGWSFEDQGIFPAAVMIKLELADSDGESHTFSTLATVHADTLLEEIPEAPAEELGGEEGEQEEEQGDEQAEKEEVSEQTAEPGRDEESSLSPPAGDEDEEIFPENPGSFPFGVE